MARQRTIDSWLETHATHLGDRPALTFGGQTQSYKGLRDRVESVAAILAEAGRIDEAREQIADLLEIDSEYNFRRYDERYPYYSAEHRQRMKDALTAAGLK